MGNRYTFIGVGVGVGVTLSKLLCLTSEKGSTLKGKILLPLGANSFFQSRPLYGKGLV